MATGSATWAYRDRFGDSYGRTFFRRFGPGVVSSVGVGTYLGDPTDEVDERSREALVTAIEHGGNVVDTAINYRHQRSERVVGRAIADATVDRDAVLVATKAGFLPFDRARPDDPAGYIAEAFLRSGRVDADDLAYGSHCITPDYVEWSLDRSLDNLGLDAVDLCYVHNPETQLAVRGREAVYDQLEAAFRTLERRRAAGDLGYYGVATWDAFRVPREHDAYLSLPAVHERARSAAAAEGVEECGFAAVQLPFNVVMADAFTVESQEHAGERTSALRYAQDVGLNVFASASLAQGALADELPPKVEAELAGDTPAQRAINFVRSAPGVTCALVGTTRASHVAENLAAGTFDPLGARAFDAVFE